MKRLLILPCLVVLLVACGGDGESKTLHLAGQDITEDNYRKYLREQASRDPSGKEAVCNLLADVDTEDAAKVLKNLTGNAAPVVWTGATPKPGQQDDPEDYETATKILQDECKR